MILAGLLSFGMSSPSLAGALLEAGHRYEFGFDTLPLVGASPGIDQGGFTAFLGANALDAGEKVRVDLYQNSFAEAPFYSYVFAVPTSLFAATVDLPPAWQDLQGKLAFTMATGTMVLDRLQVRAIRNHQLFQGDIDVTVPEPATGILAVLALVLAAWQAGLRFVPR